MFQKLYMQNLSAGGTEKTQTKKAYGCFQK